MFVDLYNDGLIYRGTRLVNWDPQAQSTLSDAEVEDEERDTFLWHIRYRAEDGGDGLVIATTRPETYLADVAVAVHPDDERYRHLIGKNVVLPIVDRAIPVIADDAVDPAFGTGAVKVTPAHDQTDYEIGQRHELPMPTVIDFDGRVAAPIWRYDETPERRAPIDAQAEKMHAYVGFDRFDARKRIVDDLRALGALVDEKPYRTTLPLSSRTHAVIEPLLSLQWFVTMQPLAQPALEAYRSGALRFVPERFGRTYAAGAGEHPRLEHLAPGLVGPPASGVVHAERRRGRRARRRRSEAHRARALRHRRAAPRSRHARHVVQLGAVAVLDPGLAGAHARARPLVSESSDGHQPRHHLLVGLAHGDARAAVRRASSRSRRCSSRRWCSTCTAARCRSRCGNAIDPMIDLVPKYGADGTRFGILRQMRLESQELRFDERYCDEAKRFATKLWNALRYTCALPEGLPGAARAADAREADARRQVDPHRAARVRRDGDATRTTASRSASRPTRCLQFGWYTFCDWYVEATKARGPAARRAARCSRSCSTRSCARCTRSRRSSPKRSG